MPMPDEIVGLLRSKITFKWPDGHETVYPARLLRLAWRQLGALPPWLRLRACPASLRFPRLRHRLRGLQQRRSERLRRRLPGDFLTPTDTMTTSAS